MLGRGGPPPPLQGLFMIARTGWVSNHDHLSKNKCDPTCHSHDLSATNESQSGASAQIMNKRKRVTVLPRNIFKVLIELPTCRHLKNR